MPSRIVVTEFMTLDGFMTGPGGDQSPFAGNWSSDLDRETLDQQQGVGALLLGRRAYEQMAAYWPTATDEDPAIYQHMNQAPKFVLSTSLTHAPWGTFDAANLLDNLNRAEVDRLRDNVDGDIAVIGSATVVQQLERLDAVDEYKIMLFPILLGDGERLFESGQRPRTLTLTRSRALSGGVAVLHYSTRSNHTPNLILRNESEED